MLKDRSGSGLCASPTPAQQQPPPLCLATQTAGCLLAWPAALALAELAPSWRRAGAELALTPAISRNSGHFRPIFILEKKGKQSTIKKHKKKHKKKAQKSTAKLQSPLPPRDPATTRHRGTTFLSQSWKWPFFFRVYIDLTHVSSNERNWPLGTSEATPCAHFAYKQPRQLRKKHKNTSSFCAFKDQK